ncbi:molybdopterin molybdotransferase MoeA [Paludibacterium yongneupense]|uniref:molybdopterin molybdotransferase MoeA n=1 Tax=Paludibacterium yongneupense TaxID=400061 RepID=UPI001FE48C70|nr:gephyrin-like molybdotransferase Glp [Paludibacterium yongneupense]
MTLSAARESLLRQAEPVGQTETVPLLQAPGRILARSVVAGLAVPPHDNSAMDGYAIRACDAALTLPISQRIPAGSVPVPLEAGTAARIFTGAMLPEGADCVVMQEHCHVDDAGRVRITTPAAIGANIRRAGEDIACGRVAIEAGRVVGAADLGLAASLGVASLDVLRPLRVAVFFTGDELVEPGAVVGSGQIYNSNRYWLVAALQAEGYRVEDLGIVPDSLAATRQALQAAAREADVVMTCGGVSMGEEDHVRAALKAEGELMLWKLALKPGKPLAAGSIGSAAFFGLPGNPVSGFVTWQVLVRDVLARRSGRAVAEGLVMTPYPAAFDWPRPDARREEFLRVRKVGSGGEFRLELYPQQGSGVLTSCAWADGLARVPPGRAIAFGDSVDYLPFGR